MPATRSYYRNGWSARRALAASLALALVAGGVTAAATSLRGRAARAVDRRVENIRDKPKGEKIGTLLQGAEVEELERDGKWVRFRLEGWIWGPSLQGFAESEAGEGAAAGEGGEGLDQRQPRAALQVKVPQIKDLVGGRYGVFYGVSLDRDLRQLVVRFRVRDLSPDALEARQRGVQSDLVELLAGEVEFESVRVETNRPDGSGAVGAEVAVTPVTYIGDPERQSPEEWRSRTRLSHDGGQTWSR
ncbi:MAG: hypothetical protein ABIL09_22250 [Gemmatimonadota bacterium]